MLSYDDYVTMGGDVARADFAPLEARAARRLDSATFGRLREERPLRECARMCLAELIDLYAEEAEASGRRVVEQQNGDLRVRYADAGAWDARRDGAVIRLWLDGEADGEGTPLLYCGQ